MNTEQTTQPATEAVETSAAVPPDLTDPYTGDTMHSHAPWGIHTLTLTTLSNTC